MLKFVGIWYNMDTEVKRDVVFARDANEASDKIHAMYKRHPAPCLTIVPYDGDYHKHTLNYTPGGSFS